MSDKPLDFLRYTLDTILSTPEELTINKQIDDLGTLYEIQVSSDDMGRLIGKNGQTIQSIRTLLRMIGSQNNERVNLKVLEPIA